MGKIPSKIVNELTGHKHNKPIEMHELNSLRQYLNDWRTAEHIQNELQLPEHCITAYLDWLLNVEEIAEKAQIKGTHRKVYRLSR